MVKHLCLQKHIQLPIADVELSFMDQPQMQMFSAIANPPSQGNGLPYTSIEAIEFVYWTERPEFSGRYMF